jgi:hypothetical protein
MLPSVHGLMNLGCWTTSSSSAEGCCFVHDGLGWMTAFDLHCDHDPQGLTHPIDAVEMQHCN